MYLLIASFSYVPQLIDLQTNVSVYYNTTFATSGFASWPDLPIMLSLNHVIKNRPTVSIWWCRFIVSQVLVYSDYFQVPVASIVDTYIHVQYSTEKWHHSITSSYWWQCSSKVWDDVINSYALILVAFLRQWLSQSLEIWAASSVWWNIVYIPPPPPTLPSLLSGRICVGISMCCLQLKSMYVHTYVGMYYSLLTCSM